MKQPWRKFTRDDTSVDPRCGEVCVKAETARSKASRYRWTGAVVMTAFMFALSGCGVSGTDSQEVQAVATSSGSSTGGATDAPDLTKPSSASLSKLSGTITPRNQAASGPSGPTCTNSTQAVTASTASPVSVFCTDTSTIATVTVTSPPAHGTVAGSVPTSMTYTPNPGYVGADGFTYTAADANGNTSAPATATLLATPAAFSLQESVTQRNLGIYFQNSQELFPTLVASAETEKQWSFRSNSTGTVSLVFDDPSYGNPCVTNLADQNLLLVRCGGDNMTDYQAFTVVPSGSGIQLFNEGVGLGVVDPTLPPDQILAFIYPPATWTIH